MPTSYKQVLDETKLVKARNQNSLAMASITMAVAKNPTCLSFINRLKSVEWPNGLASKVWNLLLEHYEPTDKVALRDLKKKLNDCRMKSNELPAMYISWLWELFNHYAAIKQPITEDDLVSQFEVGCLKEFRIPYRNLNTSLKENAKVVTLSHVEKEMMILYWMNNQNEQKDKKAENDLALIADGGTAKKSNNKKGKGKGKGKFAGTCNHCGKVGHKAVDCWDDPKNAEHRPKAWKTKQSGGDTDVTEIALVSWDEKVYLIDFEDFEDLKNENVYRECCCEDEQANHESAQVAADLGADNQCEMDVECSESYDTIDEDEELSNKENEFNETSDEDSDEGIEEIVLAGTEPKGNELLGRKDIVVTVTGASCHVFMTKEWMQNFRPNETLQGIKVGGKSIVCHEGVGNLPILLKDKDGNIIANVVLKVVKCAEGFGFNLFSLTKAIMQDWKIQSEGQMITMSKGQSKIVFDVQIDMGNGGVLLRAFVEPKNYGNNVAMIVPTEKGTKMLLMKAHQLLGHPNEVLTRKTAAHLGWSITRGKVLTCEDCTIAKARQKYIPKDPKVTEPVEKGQLLHLDLMLVKVPKGVPFDDDKCG